VPLTSVDIRPIKADIEGLTTKHGSILGLPFDDNSVPCITTLCVLEHVGLGRYGDELNPSGTVDAVREISRVIRPGGIVVYSVPVGEEMLEFNAHRRFSFDGAKGLFEGWDVVDYTILSPVPTKNCDDKTIDRLADPVACFCVRKPVVLPDSKSASSMHSKS